jgi:hypothetical protein
MAQFHFGDDYEQQLAQLLAAMPLDEAMAAVVGGHYQEIGAIECDVLRWAGLTSGMQMVDLGCGTGRLACALGKAFEIEYFGIDVVRLRQEQESVQLSIPTLPFIELAGPGPFRGFCYRLWCLYAAIAVRNVPVPRRNQARFEAGRHSDFQLS